MPVIADLKINHVMRQKRKLKLAFDSLATY